jgi:sulfite oxidase
MNGRPLTAEHGAPARLVVPGLIGARSIKWLGRVTLADRPSENHFQAHGYRIVDAESGVPGPAIEAAPLNAFVGSIGDGDEVPAGPVRLTGYATPSGTERVTAVEVALDGGTWRPAGLLDPALTATWVRWEARVDLAPGPHTLRVRAHDTAGAAQPTDVRTTWNPRGYLNNAVHTLRVVAR